MYQFIQDLLISSKMPENVALIIAGLIFIIFVIILSVVGYLITKMIILRILSYYITKNRFKWDDVLLKRKVFQRMSHIVPAIIVYFFASSFPEYQVFIERAASSYILLIGVFVIDAFINCVDDVYRGFDISKTKPIKGYLQVIKIFVFVIGAILVIANIIGESPVILLSGIGAMTAVLLIVFKDSLLGLVAGIQLSSNDMVHIGDWIEMPKYGADGDVIDITLNTVKVQNFDKTIVTIPSYSLIADSFKNWRGMKEAGGRRIKRSLYIDTSTISFCTDEMIERFKKIHFLADYIDEKQKEINKHNKKLKISPDELFNGRHLTNIGTFRAYIKNYLIDFPYIKNDMIQMVRQLPPGEFGLPLEIYVFADTTEWVEYEGIQADLFDHILAVASFFDLKIFQNPTGHDMRLGLHPNKSQ